MSKVIVGISGNEKELSDGSNIQYVAVARDLSEGVKVAGGLPVMIPMSQPELAKDYVDMVDKLILSGGQNVEPRFYGQKKEIDSDDYLLARDQFELSLIDEALRQNKPILAVCRGMQLLNVALGGSLHQSVQNHWQEDMLGTSHSLEVRPNSRVSQLFEAGTKINSLHRQSIKDLAPGLVATAHDPRDGTIEAYESKGSQSILGIQWHPEFLVKHCTNHRRLFEYVVQSL